MSRMLLDWEREFPALLLHMDTRLALEKFVDERVDEDAWDRWRYGMPANIAAWLMEVLRQTDDDPEIFPKGKWATIQHMEALFKEHCMKLVNE